MNDALVPLYAIRVALDAIDFQRMSYNTLKQVGVEDEAIQQIKAIQSQLQSVMTAYNSVIDSLNKAVANPPDEFYPFDGGNYA